MGFLIQIMQWKQFMVAMSKFYKNRVDRRDLVSIYNGQMMKKSNTWSFR